MADIPNTTDGGAAAAPGESFDSRTAPDQSGSGTDTTGDEGEGDDDGEDGGDIEDDNAEPATRSKDYYIGLRHGKKAAKQGAQKSDDEGEDGDDDDGLDPEDAQILDGAIKKAVAPLTEKLAAEEDAKELGNFLGEHPHFKPYKAKIERFMKHPSRRHLPVTTIAMEAVGPDGMMKIGARIARQADVKKGGSQGGPTGGGKRGAAPAKSVADMTPAEFADYSNGVRAKAR